MHATSVRVHVGDAKEVTPSARRPLRPRPGRPAVHRPRARCASHPDLRWRVTPEAIEALRAEQEAILAAARGALAPGGRLVYSTCTLSPREEIV